MSQLKSVDNQLYAYEYGSSPSENSFLRIQNMQAQQSEMSRQFSGGTHRMRRTRSRRGGEGEPITIPTFPGGTSSVSPIGANSVSLQANTNLIAEMNNSANDCYATNSCSVSGGKKRRTRRYRTRRYRSRRHKSRRYKISRKHGSRKH